MSGDPKYSASQDLPSFPFAEYAESLGLKGIRVDHPELVGAAWNEALAADRPCVLEAVTDPDVPPLPPHISFQQAHKFADVLMHGDPNERGIIRQAIRQLFS